MSNELASAFPVKHNVTELMFKINPDTKSMEVTAPARITSGVTKFSGNEYTVQTKFEMTSVDSDFEVKVTLETKVIGSGDFEAVKSLIETNVTKMAISEIQNVIQRCSFALGYAADIGPSPKS